MSLLAEALCVFEVASLRRGGLASQRVVAVRETAELGDDVAVFVCPLGGVGSLEQLDRAVLVCQGLAVHEGHVHEVPLVRVQLLVHAGVDHAVGEVASGAVVGEGLARAAVEGMLSGLGAGLDALRALGVPLERALLIGGAAQSPAVRAIAPALLGLPVEVPTPGEYVALGAARQATRVARG